MQESKSSTTSMTHLQNWHKIPELIILPLHWEVGHFGQTGSNAHVSKPCEWATYFQLYWHWFRAILAQIFNISNSSASHECYTLPNSICAVSSPNEHTCLPAWKNQQHWSDAVHLKVAKGTGEYLGWLSYAWLNEADRWEHRLHEQHGFHSAIKVNKHFD